MKNNLSECLFLVALPEEWAEGIRNRLVPALEKMGYKPLYVFTPSDAAEIIRTQALPGVVMYSDWALLGDDKNPGGFMELLKGKVPTVSVINSETFHQLHHRWFYELYLPPMHQYVTVPFSIEEVVDRLARALQSKDSSG